MMDTVSPDAATVRRSSQAPPTMTATSVASAISPISVNWCRCVNTREPLSDNVLRSLTPTPLASIPNSSSPAGRPRRGPLRTDLLLLVHVCIGSFFHELKEFMAKSTDLTDPMEPLPIGRRDRYDASDATQDNDQRTTG
ncbi:MAG: hypothetical protein LZF86_50037 [Nitrospira sp.]|nr:MAG: hypothetical protein LZF86_50037 [Nitrospira sp.]